MSLKIYFHKQLNIDIISNILRNNQIPYRIDKGLFGKKIILWNNGLIYNLKFKNNICHIKIVLPLNIMIITLTVYLIVLAILSSLLLGIKNAIIGGGVIPAYILYLLAYKIYQQIHKKESDEYYKILFDKFKNDIN